MPIAVAIPYVVAAATTAVTIDSVNRQKRAAADAADTTLATGAYNAKVDAAEAAQIDLDSQASVRALRQDASVYMSRQTAAYAGAGVRVGSGSPLAVQVATAGHLAMREQEVWRDANAREAHLGAAAKAGVLQSEIQADSLHAQGRAAVMAGAGRVASQLGGYYSQGLIPTGGAATPAPRITAPTIDKAAATRSFLPAGVTDLPILNAGGYA